jgi:hypothetical protein
VEEPEKPVSVIATRAAGLFITAFPASWFRVYQPFTPMSGREFLAAHEEVIACADGAMFGFCAGEPHDYRIYDCGVVDYGFFDGVTRALQLPRYPSRGASLLIEDGVARAVDGGHVREWSRASVAWQGYPSLIREGRIVHNPASDPGRTTRAGVGVLADGRVFFAAMNDSMHGFTLAGAEVGAVELLYGDGGGSGCVAARVRGGVIADSPGALDSRRVPSFVAAVRPDYWMAHGLPRRR